MSSPEQPPPGEQEPPAQHTVQIPPETPEETTQQLPPVPAQPAHQPEHLTLGLPLLDMLAPQQTGAQQPQQPGSQLPPHPLPLYSQPDQMLPHHQLAPPPIQPPPIQHQPAPHQQVYGAYGPVPPRRRGLDRGRATVLISAAGVLLLLVAAVLWVSGFGQSPPQSGPSTTAAAPTSTIKVADGFQFTQHAARSDANCAANAYGKVAEFFQATPCAGLDRALYASTVDGKLVVASVSVVRMPDQAKATELRKLADSSGTGNVNDLLRAGVRVPNGPESLTNAGYASTQDGVLVVIAEADFADRALRDDALLDRISTAALQLRK